MSEQLKIPNTTVIGELGVDEIITIIQRELSRLIWLEQSLGRVKPAFTTAGKLPEPWIYKGNGEYYPAYPNDKLQSFSCLYAHEDEQFDESGFLGSRTLSVIVWVNLQQLAIDSPTVERLKFETVEKLAALYCVDREKGFKTFDQTAAGASAIYPNFDISGLAAQYLIYPYGGFRVQCSVHYENLNCRW